jgi:hypothetical protein
MKKIKIIAISLCFLTLSLVVFAKPLGIIDQGNCPTTTVFWGTSCCKTYTTYENPLNGNIFIEETNKCCKYRLGLVWGSCTYQGTGVILNPE